MPDDDFNDDLSDLGDESSNDGDERKVTLSRSAIKGLERDAKITREAQAEAAALRQELAFSKVGIDVATPLGKIFATAYDGDMNVEAVQKAWAEVSGTSTDDGDKPPAAPNPDITSDETELTRRREALANGSRGDDGNEPEPDPREGAIKAGQEAMAAGRSRDEAMATVFSELAGAAAKGDPRVLYTPGEPYERT